MITQKKNPLAATNGFLKTKHRGKDSVVSPIVAPSGACLNNAVNPHTGTPGGAAIDRETTIDNRVVLTGIDTLAITAGGNVAPSSWLLDQVELWNEYQQRYEFGEDYITIEIDNKWWSVYPSRAFPYKFQLRNPEIGFIKVWNTDKWSSGAQGNQQIHIHFYPEFTHSYSPTNMYKEVEKIVSFFFENNEGLLLHVSRLDLHSDITNGSNFLTTSELDNAICRAKVRDNYKENKELELTDEEQEFLFARPHNNKAGGKLIPLSLLDKVKEMYENQMGYGADRVISKRDIETAYFGRYKYGILWGKIYNKTKKVIVDNDTNTPKLWEENGWNGVDCVARTEFSMKRKFLKELDNGIYVDLYTCLTSIDTLWKYLTTKWLRLVEEVKVNNSTTSTITNFWNIVSTSFANTTKNVIRKKDYRAKITQLWAQGLGCIKQMISLGMDNNEDEYFISATITALSNTLSGQCSMIEYKDRRKLLGVY